MVKILLCGQVNAQWDLVFERVKKLNAAAKGAPFEALLCVGRALPIPAAYVDGSKSVPIPTYFVTAFEDENALESDATQAALYAKVSQPQADTNGPVEVGKNLFFLGKQGVTTIEGLKVAFLSGTAAKDENAVSSLPLHYSMAMVGELIASIEKQGAHDIDFLLTAEYAVNFQKLLPEQQVPPELQTVEASPHLQKLLQVVHPKYHITSASATNGVFYQRLPYVSEHASSGRKSVTRLIGLCGVSTSKNKAHKYLHALQVTPSASGEGTVDIPAGTTQNPYAQAPPSPDRRYREEPNAKRQRVDGPKAGNGGLSEEQIAQLTAQSAQGAQFFYDQKLAARGQRQAALRQERENRRGPPVPERTECWFCLATPSVERHLIVSIGQEAYLAMPKGAINPDHLLIVPIAHEASSMKLRADTWKEVERFKSALREFFASQDKDMIVFDRNIQTIGATHCHLQVIGIPRAKAAIARRVFEGEGEKYNVRFEVLEKDADLQQTTDGKPFFYAEVPGEEGNVVRLLNFVEGKHYMQFGRHAAACVLEMPRRANWKYCVVPKPEEEQMTKQFKEQWKQFDFTLEDDDE
uniref:Cwf19-like C-terminal domain-containing protein n=1 Tax=Globisporangium ultimum (strain ATCC 200006 / CBS 805.95 / DAOM BR144) TaxID=431595 RepID=K3X1K7_GLOUD